MRKLLSLLTFTVFFKPFLAFGANTDSSFKINDPTNSLLFDGNSKVVTGFKSVEWIIHMSAGLFAITCFITAGNYARQGQVGRAAGAAIGGVISVLGAYFVHSVAK